MGATIPKCMFCLVGETEDNPIMVIYSRGKRDGQFICLNCIKKKIRTLKSYERRVNRKVSFIDEYI